MARATFILLGGVGAVAVVGGGVALFSGLTARRIEAALPPQGRFIDIAGNRIHYIDQGPKDGAPSPAIVMVHGLGGQMRNFTYALVDRLKDRFRVVVLERPGAGYSQRARGASAGLGAQADVVADFIRALGLERPLLVGHSLGGALSLAVALNHPEVASGLALISPLTQPQASPPPAFRGLAISSPLLRRLAAWTLATPMAMLNGRRLMGQVFGPERPPADFATRGGGLLGLRPRAFYATSTDLMAIGEDLPGLAERYATLKAPVGVLFGAGDAILDAERHGAALASQIPDMTYETVADAGHMIPLTRPEQVADFIVRMAERSGAA